MPIADEGRRALYFDESPMVPIPGRLSSSLSIFIGRLEIVAPLA
jgi:hypothetical protein